MPDLFRQEDERGHVFFFLTLVFTARAILFSFFSSSHIVIM
jgi:hypothetical protein